MFFMSDEDELEVVETPMLLSKELQTNIKKIKKEEKSTDKNLSNKQKAIPVTPEILAETSTWGGLTLSKILVDALEALDFTTPTPIQSLTLPTLQGSGSACDILGIAETGSGKTLAFVLPVLNKLILEWEKYGNSKTLFSMIISPTRELAMQISNVIKDISTKIKEKYILYINSTSVVGGMSEEKQRRLLSTDKKALHILVATPGRLCDVLQDEDLTAFNDLSTLRYLIIDEADRMMEEGHFNELTRIFSRIKDHEEIVASGGVVAEELKKRRIGKVAVEEGDEEFENKNPDDLYDLPMMPDEEEIQKARENYKVQLEMEKRQTLLFSATAVETIASAKFKSKSKEKLKGTLVGVASGCSIPSHIKELLAQVAIQPTIHVLDVTHTKSGELIKSSIGDASDKIKEASSNVTVEEDDEKLIQENQKGIVVALPKTLLQYEARIPAEDKDIYTYYLLFKNPGRTLIFCNSIKTVRRVDGLLRALGFPCRALHADLPQRQRIRSLEHFAESPMSILVATDVAARGLDVKMIQTVIHYDVARSPQVYIHRSGRTARAGSKGLSVSLVNAEDSTHHAAVCEFLKGKSNATLPDLKVDLSILAPLRERVQLAKKIFTLSFVESQGSKERNWIAQNAQEADLDMDEGLESEINGEEVQTLNKKQKKELARLRAQLNELLDTPIVSHHGDVVSAGKSGNLTTASGRKVIGAYTIMQGNKVVSSKNGDLDWRKRKNGFFVYAK